MERERGFEPPTSTLARLHSTTELLPLRRITMVAKPGRSCQTKARVFRAGGGFVCVAGGGRGEAPGGRLGACVPLSRHARGGGNALYWEDA